MKKYMKNLNFGAGNPAEGWLNLDSSPFFLLPQYFHRILLLLRISDRSKYFISYNYQYFQFAVNKNLPFKKNSLDTIYSSHVQEHLSVLENTFFFEEAHRILKKGGILRIIVPDLEKKIRLNTSFFSLESELLTLPQELKKNKLRAILEAFFGFPSFHKTLFVKKHIKSLFKDNWEVVENLTYLNSKIPKKVLCNVEQESRTKNAIIFELIKK